MGIARRLRIGDRLGCGRHVVDAIAEKDGRQIWKRKLAYEYDWTIYSTVLLGVLFTTLEDLAHDIAEQTQMHGRLNEMIRGTN